MDRIKKTITEMRDNGGVGTQQEVCKFLVNYMNILEKQIQEPCDDCVSRQDTIDTIHKTIYQFFDVCDNEEEVPMSDKDKLLLQINKTICNNIKAIKPAK